MSLKRARYDAGLSLEDLAARADVTEATLVRIEKGKTFPNAATAKKIADALDCKPSDLFFDSAEAAA